MKFKEFVGKRDGVMYTEKPKVDHDISNGTINIDELFELVLNENTTREMDSPLQRRLQERVDEAAENMAGVYSGTGRYLSNAVQIVNEPTRTHYYVGSEE